MKKKALVCTMVALLGLAILLPTSLAADLVQDITAQINQNVTILWDGQVFVPTDASGNVVQPIIYENRVYVPLRSFGVESGCTVAWEPDTKTVNVNSPETDTSQQYDDINMDDVAEVALISLISDFTPSKSDSNFEMGSVSVNGIRYDTGFYNNGMTTSSAFWQLQQKYSTLTFELASTNSIDDAEGMWIYADGATLYNSPKIASGQILKYELDLTGYNELTLVLGPNTAIIAADIIKIAD